MRPEGPFGWSLVVPVKLLARAKSRLSALAGADRPALALAVAADTVLAALGCSRVRHVIVVTDDELAGHELGRLGAVVVGDGPAAGLNPALEFGAAQAAFRDPRSGIAALSADLPALRSVELDLALRHAARWPQAIVPDASGRGTTLYTTRPGIPFRPRFGAESRRRHVAAGAREISSDDLPGLRRDVDTAADLGEAAALGLGPATAPLAARLLRGTGTAAG
jgi:2-phospho-L-lactate/phosphoenolpyruvate guanylyltransferase